MFTTCSVCSSIPTFQCELVYNESRHAVSSLCASCVAFGDKCQASCSSGSPLRLFSVGWNTVTNSVLVAVGLSRHITKRYQSVQNAAVRLMFGIHRSEHITYATYVFTCSKSSFWHTELFTAAHLTCCRVSLASTTLTSHLAEDSSGPQLPTSYLYLLSFRL